MKEENTKNLVALLSIVFILRKQSRHFIEFKQETRHNSNQKGEKTDKRAKHTFSYGHFKVVFNILTLCTFKGDSLINCTA